MVAGDLMLDTYTIGKVHRISPEAPVPVVHVYDQSCQPGGAGNVLLNLSSLGAEVVALGRVGDDNEGRRLLKSLQDEAIDVRGVFVQPTYTTPNKNRVIADNQQIVRVDHEEVIGLPELLEEQIIAAFPELLDGVQVLAISDYGKGFLTDTLLAALIEAAKKMEIFIIADPKGIDFNKYSGVDILKPNLSEAYAAAGMARTDSLNEAAHKIHGQTSTEILMITRSEKGISLFYRDGSHQNFPVRIKEVKDVTGAGDTVLAMLTVAVANKLSIAQAVELANIAAGIAIEHIGCARVKLSELARRLLELDVSNKVFDEEHLHTLMQALDGQEFSLIGLSSQEGLTPDLFLHLRELAVRTPGELLIYVRDDKPDPSFINVLASLRDVDFIILKSESFRGFSDIIKPKAVYTYASGSVKRLEEPYLLLS